jgi:hypothetical protein
MKNNQNTFPTHGLFQAETDWRDNLVNPLAAGRCVFKGTEEECQEEMERRWGRPGYVVFEIVDLSTIS